MSTLQGQQGQSQAIAKASAHLGTCAPRTRRRGYMQPAASLLPSHTNPSVTSQQIYLKASTLGPHPMVSFTVANHTRGVSPVHATCAACAPVSSSVQSSYSGTEVTAALNTLEDAIGEDSPWRHISHLDRPSPAQHKRQHLHQQRRSHASHQPTAQSQAYLSQGHLQPHQPEDLQAAGPHSSAPRGAGAQQQAAQRSEDLLLSRQIKKCRTWHSLWCVFQECRHLLNHVHLTALAGGMAKAQPGPAASVAEEQEYRRWVR
eukprot:1159557-Pelagomonas_calceolata.AAC.7